MTTLILVPSSGKHTTKKNSMEIHKRGDTRFISQSARCKLAQLDLHRQAAKLHPFPFYSDVPFILDMVFVFPTDRKPLHGLPKLTRPDTGNLGALVCDALEGVLYADDAQVVVECVSKVWGPRCEVIVTLTEWSGPT